MTLYNCRCIPLEVSHGATTERSTAIDRGLSLMAAGAPREMLFGLARSYAAQGLADAADGYAYLASRMTIGGAA